MNSSPQLLDGNVDAVFSSGRQRGHSQCPWHKNKPLLKEIQLSPQEVGGVLLIRTTFSQQTARVPWGCSPQQPSPSWSPPSRRWWCSKMHLRRSSSPVATQCNTSFQVPTNPAWSRLWTIRRKQGARLNLLCWLSHQYWAIIPWQIRDYQCALILTADRLDVQGYPFLHAWKMGDHRPKVLVK